MSKTFRFSNILLKLFVQISFDYFPESYRYRAVVYPIKSYRYLLSETQKNFISNVLFALI